MLPIKLSNKDISKQIGDLKKSAFMRIKYFVAICDIKFVSTSNFSFSVVLYTYTLKDHHIHGYMKYMYSLHKVTLTAKKLDSTRRLSELIHIRE